MPNQLANNKKRKSLAEHEVVLAALEIIAQDQGVSSMELMRKAIREEIRKHTSDPASKNQILAMVSAIAPQAPAHFASAAKLARFKRRQREFNQILMDLHLVEPNEMEKQNSLVDPKTKIRILEFEPNHG